MLCVLAKQHNETRQHSDLGASNPHLGIKKQNFTYMVSYWSKLGLPACTLLREASVKLQGKPHSGNVQVQFY